MFDIIACVDQNNLIGQDNDIPWRSSIDQQFFKKITTQPDTPGLKNVVIMGRKTNESIGRDLPNRINYIIKRTEKFDKVIEYFINRQDISKIFVIGGAQIYKLGLNSKYLRYLYITELTSKINLSNPGNYIFFPCNLKNKFKIVSKNKIDKYITFTKYINEKKINNDEYQYIDLLNKILTKGHVRQTRNALTYSIFGEFLKFNLNGQFPILTTKRIYWRGVVEELLFFIRGQTNTNILTNKKVHIWTDNTRQSFLKKRKLDYETGDMGPMYGFQWSHFGAEYKGMNHDYTGQGYNQLENVIHLLKTDPYNRRILMTTYNPLDINKSVLAPCHGLVVQFYVSQNKLSCHMYQRSSDSFLGLPFNISSYSLLTYIIAREVELEPGELSISLGDCHVYDSHYDAVKEQLTRDPTEFPTLEFDKKKMTEYNFDDFRLINYNPGKIIKAAMIP